MVDSSSQPTWDFVFPEGGFDFENLPVPIINCLENGTVEQIEQVIAVIRIRSGATQATAWLTLFEQLLHIRRFVCNQEKKLIESSTVILSGLTKDAIIDLPDNCIGLCLTFVGIPINFEVRTSLSLKAPAKFNFGGVCFLQFGGYTNEKVLEREVSFISCSKSAKKALIYLLPRVTMKVEAIVEQ